MIKCAICGKEKKYSIAEHLKFDHSMTSKQYKEIYHQEVRSEEFKKNTSEYSKEVWNRDGYKEKMSEIQKDSHSTIEYHQKTSSLFKEKAKNGELEYFIKKGKTKENDISIKNRSTKISNSLIGRKNPEHSKRLKETLKKQKEENPEEWIKRNLKRSKTICDNLAKGCHNLGYNQYKRGWYKDFYFASSYEEKTMIYLDSEEKVKSWTNKHGIVIRYIDDDNTSRGYVPDFKIELKNGIEIIVEIKAEKLINSKNVLLKKDAAINIYKEKYFLISTVDELKEIINEWCKN